MIKETELRIGNYTSLHHKDLVLNKITAEDLFKGAHIFSPITLTEGWLIKFGYKHTSKIFGCNVYRRGLFFVSIDSGTGVIVFGV